MNYKTLLESIGNTPLIKVPFATEATVLAKLEYLNPGGSVKDRSALYLIEKAEKEGILKPGGTIIDASSGNHGIALAMIGAIKGYKVIITVTPKCSKEKYQTMAAYGAELVMCPSKEFMEDPESYHSQAVALHKKTPNSFMPNQYYNIDNRTAHYQWLGSEIWTQTEGKITHFFAAAGTTGTVSGVGRYLKEKNPSIKVYAIDAATSYQSTNGNPKPYKIEGMGMDFINDIADFSVFDSIIPITDDEGLGMLPVLSQNYGLLVGPSSGAVAAGVLKKLPLLQKNDLAVMICGDSGRAYLTKNFYDQIDENLIPALPIKKAAELE